MDKVFIEEGEWCLQKRQMIYVTFTYICYLEQALELMHRIYTMHEHYVENPFYLPSRISVQVKAWTFLRMKDATHTVI